MKIDGANNINNIPKINNIPGKPIPEVNKVDPPVRTERNPGAIYQQSSKLDDFQTYNLKSIEKLIKESENVYAQLKEVVEDMLVNQDKLSNVFNRSKPVSGSGILKPPNPLNPASQTELDQELMGQIKDLIESQGKLGFEAMSKKIADIVKDASGGEQVKIEILTQLIDEVFKEGEEKLGGLSSLSTKTYDKIMEKLDGLLSVDNLKDLPENLKTELKTMIEGMLTKQAKAERILSLAGKENLNNPLLSEIKEMIGSTGRLGTEVMSGKIADLVKAAADGDSEKVASLVKEIQNTFEDAEKTLGKLPEISTKTYDRTIEKLEDLLPASPSKVLPETAKLELKTTIEGLLTNQSKAASVLSLADKDAGNSLISQAKEVTDPNGKLSIETISDKIVNLVNELADGDPKQISSLTKEVRNIFNGVEKTLGKLPEVTINTYDRTIEKLEASVLANRSNLLPESVKLELGQMIEGMVGSQVKTLAILKGSQVSMATLNKAEIAEAQNLLRPDGLLGVIAMSTQIVKFAKKSAGGDAEKLADIINQIRKNFSEVKNTLGDLPDITEETYEMMIQKLEEDLLELSEKGLKTFDKLMSMLEWFRERNIPIQRYALAAGGGALIYWGMRLLF